MTAAEIAEIIRSHGYSVDVRGPYAIVSLSNRRVSMLEIDEVLLSHGWDIRFAMDRVGNSVSVEGIS